MWLNEARLAKSQVYLLLCFSIWSAGAQEADRPVQITGEIRSRWRAVSSTGVQPLGTFGEALQEGQTYVHQALVEAQAGITPGVTAGVLLRLSDEGEAAFRTGPLRLAEERGSVRLQYQCENTAVVMGYYRLHLTPLLLMRWDTKDNPEGGGAVACACPGAGGSLTAGSLERIEPNLLLEGVKVQGVLGAHSEWLGILARPRVAEEGSSFQQFSYALGIRCSAFHRPSTSFRSVGLTFLCHCDDAESVDNPLAVPYRPQCNWIGDLEAELPVGNRLVFRAEAALSQVDENRLATTDAPQRGSAVLTEAEVRYPRMQARVAYLRLSPGFRSRYQALSYLPNREGVRLAAVWEVRPGRFSAWGFYKRLQSIRPVAGQTYETLGLGNRLALGPTVWGQPAVVLQREPGSRRVSLIGELTHAPVRTAELVLRYQYVDYQDPSDPALDHHTQLLLLLSSVSW
ncbi:MAG: hypothetical protein AB1514_07200 [Pseudomonadota bacterium]